LSVDTFVFNSFVAGLSDGSFVVTWFGSPGTMARRYDGSGVPIGAQFVATTFAGGAFPREIVATSDGGFTILSAGSPTHLLGKTFCVDATGGDEDGDGVPNRCDLCPNADDSADGDADGVPDACDECTSVGDAQTISDARLRLFAWINHYALTTFSGKFLLGTSFASIDPVANGARMLVRLEDADDVLDISIPGGAYDGVNGWRSNSANTRHIYKGSDPGGVRQLVLIDQSDKVPGLVKFKVKSSNPFALPNSTRPHHNARIIVGDPTVGECGETQFQADECDVRWTPGLSFRAILTCK
jgi:hypothetical protein